MTPQRILLLHGLWLRGFTLHRLASRLRAAGFPTEMLDFGSVRDEPEQTIARLCERLGDERLDGERLSGEPRRVGIVGHSLGGVLALEALRRHPELPVTRVVCLGSPLRGSRVAARLANTPAAPWMLGHSARLLREGVPPWQGRAEVGVLAGCTRFGLGTVLARLPAPHDGTVCAEETRLGGIADHAEVRTTHTGLLFSREAAMQTVQFLRTGRFQHGAPGASVPSGTRAGQSAAQEL